MSSFAAAMGGSLVGVMSSFATTWLTQRNQACMQARSQEVIKCQALYAEFIAEAAQRIADGLELFPVEVDRKKLWLFI